MGYRISDDSIDIDDKLGLSMDDLLNDDNMVNLWILVENLKFFIDRRVSLIDLFYNVWWLSVVELLEKCLSICEGFLGFLNKKMMLFMLYG